MRVSEKKQVLTTSAVNLNGVQIPTDCIDWSVYDKNPVLLYNRANESHKGVVVGKVLNRERVGDAIVANLAFMERNEDADIAFEKYDQGVCLTFPWVDMHAARKTRRAYLSATST